MNLPEMMVAIIIGRTRSRSARMKTSPGSSMSEMVVGVGSHARRMMPRTIPTTTPATTEAYLPHNGPSESSRRRRGSSRVAAFAASASTFAH